MSDIPEANQRLIRLLVSALTAILNEFMILRVVRSFSNEIVDYVNVFDSNPADNANKTISLSDHRLLYIIKKILGAKHENEWVSLQGKMILPLSRDEVLVVPFDGHRHEPMPQQLSIVLGFDGVSHLGKESISLRLISRALENLTERHHPFAFGIINIDNFQRLLAEYDQSGKLKISERVFKKIQERLNQDDFVAAISDNEFATILTCESDVQEVFPRLWELSSLSNTPISLGEMQIPVHFSAGYVLIPDSFTTAKEILDEAISMMYKSKSNGKNGYYLSDSHHSASDPSL